MARKNAATRPDLQGNFDLGTGKGQFTAKPSADAADRHENQTSGYPLTRTNRRPPAQRKNAAKRMPGK